MGAAPTQVSPGGCCHGAGWAGSEPFSGVPGWGQSKPLPPCMAAVPRSLLPLDVPLCAGAAVDPGQGVFSRVSLIQTVRAVHSAEHGGSHPLLPRTALALAQGCPEGSNCKPPSPAPCLLSSGSILRAPGCSQSQPCTWSCTTAGARHWQVHSRNPHGCCGNHCPAHRRHRPLMRQ